MQIVDVPEFPHIVIFSLECDADLGCPDVPPILEQIVVRGKSHFHVIYRDAKISGCPSCGGHFFFNFFLIFMF